VSRLKRASVVLAALVCISLASCIIGAYLWAAHHYRQAEQDLSKRDFAAAYSHLDAYLQVHQYDGEAHYLAARTARRAGLADDARRHLEDCERLGWPSRDAIALERMLMKVQNGEVAESEDFLMSCVESDHEDAILILEALSEGYLRTFKMGMAEFCVNKLLERQPDNPLAYLWRGELRDQRRSTQPAIDDYHKALDLDPELDEARFRLAEKLIQIEQVREALPHFEQLHAKHPDDLRFKVGLAECYVKTSALEEARDLLDSALVETGESRRAFYAMTKRASLAMLMGRPADAEKWSRKALILEPNSQENLYNLYHSLDLLERHDEARIYEAKWHIAEDATRRIGTLMEQVLVNPDDPAPQHEIGVLHLRQGRDDLGLMWLVSALQADPSYRPTLLALADYYEKKGDIVRIKEFRRRAQVDAAPIGDGPGAPRGNR